MKSVFVLAVYHSLKVFTACFICFRIVRQTSSIFLDLREELSIRMIIVDLFIMNLNERKAWKIRCLKIDKISID